MNDAAEAPLQHHPGGTPGIAVVLPKKAVESMRGEMRLHIGLFFDRTGSNRYAGEPMSKTAA